MTDEMMRTRYGDLVDETDDQTLLAVLRRLEGAYPRVEPPGALHANIRDAAASPPSPRRPRRWATGMGRHRNLRRSVAVAAVAVLAATVLGGAGYAMRILSGSAGPKVVESCTGFGAHWKLAGAGAHETSTQQFVASGGRLVPGWQRQAVGLQRPRYWVTPADAHLVDTCIGSSSRQALIGTNRRAQTQLLVISVVPLWRSNQPTAVGSLRIPAWGGCAPRPVTPPVTAPHGRPVAQLYPVPPAFARSVGATIPPCSVSRRPSRPPSHAPPPSQRISFQILSQIDYTGSGGTVVVLAARPSSAALRPGLDLGTPAGALPDGARLWELHCSGPCSPGHLAWTYDLRWMRGGAIVSVSGNLPVAQLKALAARVVVG